MISSYKKLPQKINGWLLDLSFIKHEILLFILMVKKIVII